MAAYYNELDRYAAQWLRNLIARDLIAPGDVDERSILDVQPDDLKGYDQHHFFAGIGGWSYALRLAGWPDDRPVWTGSCPCQPFSAAGKQRGSDDERHLWPAFFNLIRKCGPGSVFGEQVAGAAGLAWLDHVCADLEGAGYAAAAAALPACSVGAHHRRERLFWVAHAEHAERGPKRVDRQDGRNGPHEGWQEAHGLFGARSQVCSVADADGGHASAEREQRSGQQRQQPADGGPGLLGNAGNEGLEIERRFPGVSRGSSGASARQATQRADPLAAWADIEWIECSDGKARPTKPGLFPLVDGVRNGRLAIGRAIGQAASSLSTDECGHVFSRVGVLRGAGNAIVPQVAAAFVMASYASGVVG